MRLSLSVQFLAFSLVNLVLSLASKVVIANDDNFEEIIIQSGKHSFVEFYASWCGHCKTLSPVWDSLSDEFAVKEDVQIVKIDADENRKVGSMFSINSFPTLKFFNKDNVAYPLPYEGSRDLESFKNFITANTGIKVPGTKNSPSMVVQLHDGSIERMVQNKGKSAFVVFTADWCTYCKELMPTWKELASIFHPDVDKILISEVQLTGDEPTDWLKNKYEISRFPTVLYFHEGNLEEPEVYEASRELADLIEFVNNKIGTQRASDGNLRSDAGILLEVDEEVKDFVGSPRSERRLSVMKVVKGLRQIEDSVKIEAVKYYVKLMNSLVNGPLDFIDKEVVRLTELLADNIDQDAKDSMIFRLNILKYFQSCYTDETFMHEKEEL